MWEKGKRLDSSLMGWEGYFRHTIEIGPLFDTFLACLGIFFNLEKVPAFFIFIIILYFISININ